MDAFKCLDNIIKYAKDNPKEMALKHLVGKRFNHECPNCKEVTEIEILDDGNARCAKCNSILNVTYETHKE